MPNEADNLNVLIIEDEFIIADEICMAIEDAGYNVLGPAATVEQAFALLGEGPTPDFVVMDANLNGTSSAPLVATLEAQGIPFCVCTGYRSSDIHLAFGNATTLQKPINTRALLSFIASRAKEKPV